MYCTGGTSNDEHWNTDPDKSRPNWHATTECCCAYNMMKLTRHLFGWYRPPRDLMDYYERTLLNHRLGTMTETGHEELPRPLGSGYWKTYGGPSDSIGVALARARRSTRS